MLKGLAGFVVVMYLVGAVAVAVEHYGDRPDQTIFDALEYGVRWPGLLLDIVRSPSL